MRSLLSAPRKAIIVIIKLHAWKIDSFITGTAANLIVIVIYAHQGLFYAERRTFFFSFLTWFIYCNEYVRQTSFSPVACTALLAKTYKRDKAILENNCQIIVLS